MGSRKRKPALESYTLVASIRSIEQSYSISEERSYRRVDDEAVLLLKGAIERISTRYNRHHGKEIEIQLLCARSFDRDHPSAPVEKPFLMSVSFRGAVAGVGAYLPSDAFWALADMIKSKEVNLVEIDFSSSRYGFAELLNLNFAPAQNLRPPDQI